MTKATPRRTNPPLHSPAALFLRSLAEPARYRARLEKLAALEAWRADRLGAVDEGGERVPLELGLLLQEAAPLARALAGEVSRGQWQPLPGRAVLTRLDKDRLVYHFEALDLCVHGVVADALAALVSRRLSPCVHSYLPGHSNLLALRGLGRYLRAHQRERPDPRTRGLFVLRRDVRAYGDSARLDAGGPLWAQLRALLGGDARDPLVGQAMAVIENVLRPPIRGESGGVHQNVRGLPTGSPAHNVMLNLHLTPLDDVLGAIGGGFYARFGDDFLFAHPEVEVARKASAQIDEVVASLALEIQPRKRRNLWLNGAGRASPAADFLSAQETQFLGAAVTFRGNLRLPPSKSHQLFAELERRLAQTARLAREGPPLSGDDELRLLCEVVAAGFDRHSVFALPHLGALLGEIDDRGHLHDLEQRLARLVLRVARGARSLRALRTIPPSRLREMGLPSLVLLRGRRR